MKPFIALIILSFFTEAIFAQNASIKGKIISENGEGVSFATVLLQSATDSAMVKANASGDKGDFIFNAIMPGKYYIEATYVGYGKNRSKDFDYDGKSIFSVPAIRLESQTEQLEEVTVLRARPIVDVQPDKTVFNVEGSVNATGNSALELLRKSPGVVVDNNDNLMLQGKNGVKVYIDGKPSPLSNDDLANYLKSLQSNEIDAIEIITNPSAKYEAEGNAGIINIRLIKNKSMGGNGSVNLGYRYGKNSKYNGSINFNYRNSLLNTFGTYSFNSGDYFNLFNLYREQSGKSFDQRNQSTYTDESHGFKFGTDFFLSEKSTIGFLINGNINDNKNYSISNTEIKALSTNETTSFLRASNDFIGERNNLNFNLNYVYSGNNDKTINIDLDYGRYRNDGVSYQPNRYFEPDGVTLTSERIFSNVTPTDINIYTAKVDWESNLLGGKVGLGAKISMVETDNTFDNFDIIEEKRVKNLDRSNNFVYREDINAAYATWQKQLYEKWNFMLGLRMEQTDSKGDLSSEQTAEDEVVKRDYVDFFPSGGLTYQMNDKNNVRLNYSRRIDRPSYQDLNPFEFKLDKLTFQKGNPFLKPQYSNSYSLTHTYNNSLSTSLSYTSTNNVFTRITDKLDENSAILTFVNLAKQTNLALTISYPFSVNKWWNVYATLTGFRIHNEANIEGKIIDLNANAANFYAQNTFLLPEGFKLELSGWYNSPAIWAGNWTTSSQFDISAGISKQFLNERLNLKASVSDIFKTNPWSGESRFGDLYMRGNGSWESRQIRLNLSYLFGNNQVKASRSRETGLEEEQKRIGESN